MTLKLTRLPHGTNRNRTLRRPVEMQDEDVDLTELDHGDGDHYEIVGESETFVPARKGVNRHVLREPIPVRFKDMVGFVQPAEATVPFRKVIGWKTLIAARPLERPLMRRDRFAMYGWRYSLRVFWRVAEEGS
jgi:hypothetical protein